MIDFSEINNKYNGNSKEFTFEQKMTRLDNMQARKLLKAQQEIKRLNEYIDFMNQTVEQLTNYFENK